MPSNFYCLLGFFNNRKPLLAELTCSYSNVVASFSYSVSERDGLGIWHVMNISYIKCGGRSDLIQFSSTVSFKKKKREKTQPTTTTKNTKKTHKNQPNKKKHRHFLSLWVSPFCSRTSE